jgi:hypothetical protein
MSSIPAHGEVYSIQHYVMKFVSDLVVSSINKTDNHDITEILLKVALITTQWPKAQATIIKTLHRKLKIEQHILH